MESETGAVAVAPLRRWCGGYSTYRQSTGPSRGELVQPRSTAAVTLKLSYRPTLPQLFDPRPTLFQPDESLKHTLRPRALISPFSASTTTCGNVPQTLKSR